MASTFKIDNDVLREAGLALMSMNGKPLTKRLSKGRSMMYQMQNGETVRIRTCNDHILIVLADKPSADARLNIEGTDWLLVVMPKVERTNGTVIGYLVPVKEAVSEARRTHRDWLATNPNTKGGNRTWNLRFGPDGPDVANGYAKKWACYRLDGDVSTQDFSEAPAASAGEAGNLRTIIEAARINIANAAGVEQAAVKISIDFGA